MEKALVIAGIFIGPTTILIIGFRLSGRKVDWVPLRWAGFACLVYILLLKSRSVIPVPVLLEGLPLIWFGKLLSLAGTVAMLCFVPRVGFRAAGMTWRQDRSSLRPVLTTGAITVVAASVASFLFMYNPNTSVENLLFQATLPGLDEELFMRGLLLLLLHQAFGRGLKIGGADTGWGFWLVVAVFGLLHGVTVESSELQLNLGAIASTGFVGFILTWMRERTGSLVVPVLFHNLFNVAQAFV